MKRLFSLMAVVVLGCEGAHREGVETVDAGAEQCGSTTCDQIPEPSCVDDDTLREYAATCTEDTCSYPATDIECGAAGCCGDHCCVVMPSNADSTGTLMSTGLIVGPLNGTFDTGSDCHGTSKLGTCSVVERAGMPEACVCRMDELTIGKVLVTGPRALVILAHGTVRIETSLDVSGQATGQGPGAITGFLAGAPTGGGCGGAFGTVGGFGGHGGGVGSPRGDTTLIPLHGGMRGQDGGEVNGGRGSGGGGGGALQITAGVKIEVLGAIYAGGGGGGQGLSWWGSSGGAGGGSGGAILLEAPSIVSMGRLDANGGGGGGAGGDYGTGWPGESARDELPSGGRGADGAGCSGEGFTDGGEGGNGATSTTPAGNGQFSDTVNGCSGGERWVGGGGGGGGLGRIRINTLSSCNCTGNASPTPSFGTLGVQ